MDSITFKSLSDVGLVRDNNEDSFISEFIWDEQHLLCAAIDGVGGYEGGEVAAEIARSTIIEFVNKYKDSNLHDLVTQAVLQANNKIYEQRENGQFPNMSCVLSVAIIDTKAEKIHIAHVGDSRIYLYNKGLLTKLTHDHSLVGYREEIGELTEEEAMNHPRRNIIERCLGERERIFGDGNFVDSATFDIPAGGKFVFCSDGLTDMVTQSEIRQILASANNTSAKCQMLIDCAKSHGGKDNVTVVLVETTKTVISSEEVTVSFENTTPSDQSQKSLEPDKPNNTDQSDEKEIPNKRKWCWIIPISTLAAGLLIGFLIGRNFTPTSTDISSKSYSWEEILQWVNTSNVVNITDSAVITGLDSVLISAKDYYQLTKFYDASIPKIIEKIDENRELQNMNDSLLMLLSKKDSLLSTISVNDKNR